MASLEPRVLSQVVRDGLIALVFGFGYRAGILDSFIKTQQPCSAEELAKQAGMKVRKGVQNVPCNDDMLFFLENAGKRI